MYAPPCKSGVGVGYRYHRPEYMAYRRWLRYPSAMDRELEALDKTCQHAAHIARPAGLAEEHLGEGRFEDVKAALRLIEKPAVLGKNSLGPFLNR